jgi:hypothetical protein
LEEVNPKIVFMDAIEAMTLFPGKCPRLDASRSRSLLTDKKGATGVGSGDLDLLVRRWSFTSA